MAPGLGYKVAVRLETISAWLTIAIAFCIPLSTTLTDLLFCLAILTSLAAGNWYHKAKMMLTNPCVWWFAAFFGMFVLGLSYTTAPISSAVAQLTKYDKFFFACLLLPLFTLPQVRQYAIYAFLSAVAIMLLASYAKALGFIQYTMVNGGPVEVFKGHIEFSFVLAFAAYVVTDLLLTTPKYRLLLASYLGLLVFNLFFMGYGRSGYFVFLGLAGLFCLQHLHGKRLWLALVALLVFVSTLGLMSHTVQERCAAVVTDIDTYHHNQDSITSMGLRIEFVKNSLRLIKKHPFLGTGTGSLRTEYAKLQPTPKVLTNNPHNEYLNITVQFGIVGCLVLLGMFGSQLWLSRQLPHKMRNLMQAVVVAIMVGSLANSWLMDTTEGHFYVYFIMLAGALYKQDRLRIKVTNEYL